VHFLKRLLLVTGVVLVVVAAVAVGGSLLSLDWGREHSSRTAALPLFSASAPDGLVRIPANGMTFRARVAGLSGSGPGLILLHGFPETSAMWEALIEPAVAVGYRVVAFDQRGYSPGARPDGVENYLVPEMIGDVLAVADAVGFERFHLVGHDWGCVVGWGVAIQHPDRLYSWTGLSIPHPGTLLADLRREPPTYIKIFTAPFVPEIMLTFNGMARLREGYQGASDAQRDEYLAVFSEPGAVTAALNWYRGITAGLDSGDEVAGPVSVRTLFLWGTREAWVTRDALARQRELVTGPYAELELDAGHFLMREQLDATLAAVLEHLGRTDLPAAGVSSR
jgi:pimeloyl-ACP methyl ester carboxylesterase